MAPPLCSYQVYTERTFDAFYRLSEPGVQIRAHVEDIVRSKVTKTRLTNQQRCMVHLCVQTCVQMAVVYRRMHARVYGEA